MMKLFLKKTKRKGKLQENTLSSLAPKVLTKDEDVAKVRPYLEKLKQTIDAKSINNIALTGSYGSGKSTVLQTFKRLYLTEYSYLNISLASFNSNKKSITKDALNKEERIKREELERLLEISILQQIFYHVKPSQIPESRFKRIINIPTWRLWTISMGFTVWLFSLVLLIKYNYLDKLNPHNWNLANGIDWISIIIFIFTFSGIGLFSKAIVGLFSNSKINKVNIKGELELGESVTKSVFNEHLEEILYFFERTDYNVVIIEDLDRFDNTDIFTKLREINILLNNSKLINRDIKFIYAVGDDLFNDKKERVKFFEYIIPVISFINSSNADEQLKTLIKEAGLKGDIFPKEFLSDVITFIDDIDMRLLTNIFHEFVIYRNTIKPEFIKKEEELLSIIIYKNLDPEDFNKLNTKEGKLFDLLNNKSKYICRFLNEIEKDIEQKTQEIKNIEAELNIGINELNAIYLNKILSKLPNESLVKKSSIEETFDKIIVGKRIAYQEYNSYYRQIHDREFTFDFSKIEKEVNSDFSYKERVELQKNKINNRSDVLRREIEELKSRKLEIQYWDLKQIFKEIDINQYLQGFSNDRLLRNLILEGYINENYNDYISIFHEVSLTKDDFSFERNVKSGFTTKFNLGLTNKETLANRIDAKYFERETILNFDLVDYLGKNYLRYSDKYNAVIKLLCNEKQSSIGFIDGYIKNEDRSIGLFIEKLTANWKGFWEFICFKSNYTKDKEDYYLSLILRFAKIDDIVSKQNNNALLSGIIERSNFLSLVRNTKELNYYYKISGLIDRLNIKFERLDTPTTETKELFDFVYNHCRYQINKGNILQMLATYGNGVTDEDFEKSNYTTILNSGCKPLIDYIDTKINYYVGNVYLQIEANKFDSEESLLSLLNNNELSLELKTAIIQRVQTTITDLRNIDNIEVKIQVLINNKVTPTWNNVTSYYTDIENEIDETLVTFLDLKNVYTALANEKMPSKDEKFDYPMFRMKLLLCDSIDDASYKSILKSSIYTRDSLEFKGLSKSKVEYLVDKILNTTKENYTLLRENFPNYHITLLENDFEKFLNNYESFDTDNKEVILILKSNKIVLDDKIVFISRLDSKSIINSNEISKIVGEIILTKGAEVKVDFEVLVSLVKNLSLVASKVKLINIYLKTLNNDELTHLVECIGGSYKELFEKQHKPKFDNTDYHINLFNALKSRGLIRYYDTDKRSEGMLRVIANY